MIPTAIDRPARPDDEVGAAAYPAKAAGSGQPRPGRAGPAGRRHAIALLMLVVVGALAGLVVCELIVRVAGPALPASFSTRALQELHPIYGVFHRPGASAWLRDREFTTFVRFNRDGLRGPETPPPTPGTRRVLVLGDSFVEGAEVAEDETLTAVIARALQADGQPADVLNAGVRGWGTAQEYLYLIHQGLQLQPDTVVLVFYVGNDPIDNSAELSRAAPDGVPLRPFFGLDGQSLVLTPVVVPSAGLTDGWLAAARDHSALANLVESGVATKLGTTDQAEAMRKTDRLVFAWPEPPAFAQSWVVTERLIVAARDATRSTGARFLLVVAPHKAQLDPAELDRLVRGGMPVDVQAWEPELPNRRLAAIAARDGIETLDLTPAFRAAGPAESLYFAENSHWTVAGHQVAGSALARWVRATH